MPRAKKAKLWEDHDMIAAINAVKNGMSHRAAAAEHNVPKSTLTDRLTGKVIQGSKSGPETILSADDENKLAAYLINVSKKGYGKSKEIILYMATAIAKKRGKVIKGAYLSKKWWAGFLNRHPEISIAWPL
jgi:hypothetical protein